MRRDENLLAAVNAGAERDKQILAALNRDGSFKKHVKNISDSLEKKLQHGAARRDKRKNLKDFEIKPDYVDPDPFARGGQAVVKLGEYAGETVCIKCINMIGVPAALPCATSAAQNRLNSSVIASSSLLSACLKEPPGMYSITKPRYVASVVMMPSTCTIRGCLNLTIMLSSVAKEEYIFMRSAAGTPTCAENKRSGE